MVVTGMLGYLLPIQIIGINYSVNMKISVSYEDGPFKFLTNKWEFNEDKDHCEINFYLDFEFKNIFFQSLMESLFSDAFKRMVSAFEKRAAHLYNN